MDVIAGIELLGAIAAQPNPGQIIADFRTLYAAYSDAKAKGLDVASMIKAGTLKTEVSALSRTSALADKLLADPTHGPQIEAFLTSVVKAP